MNINQYPFEIARDIATILLNMETGDEVNIVIRKINPTMFNWNTDNGNMPCGPGEVAMAMREAYSDTFNRPREWKAEHGNS